jgi:hypothetical protein
MEMERKENHRMTQKSMVQLLTGIYQYGRTKLTVNKGEKIIGRE